MKINEDSPRLESDEKINIDIDFEKLNIRKRRRFPIVVLLLLVLLAVISIFLLKKSKGERLEFEPNIDASLKGEDGWYGAFESEEIFNACKEVSVSIIAQGRRCSGFVYSPDGWIVTVEGAICENVRGRIEVLLFDGRSFEVEAYRQNRQTGIVLMKIDAEGLKTASLDFDGEIFAGEELFTFCSVDGASDGGSLFSGKVAHTQRSVEVSRADGGTRGLRLFQIGILLTEEGVGAPLFKENGELVGISCARDALSGERYMVDHAFSIPSVKALLSTMKEGKRAEDNVLFSVIVGE